MGPELKQIKNFFFSFEGLILILFFVFSVIIGFFGYDVISLFISSFGLFLAIILLVRNRFNNQKIVLERINIFSSFIDNFLDDEFVFYNLKKHNKEGLKEKFVEIYGKKLGDNISYDYMELFEDLIEQSLNMNKLHQLPERDFVKYYFYGIYSEKNLMRLRKEYEVSINTEKKNRFLDLVYSYFIKQNKIKNLEELFSLSINLSDDKRRKALFFIKGNLEEVTSILNQISSLKDSEEKNIYLEKLNEELRENLSEKGISLEKYHEAAFSKSNNAYLIFHQKLGDKIKTKFLEKRIKNIPLPFTGPFVVLSEKVKTTSELRKILELNPKKTESHNLIILKLNTADTFISAGLEKNIDTRSKISLEKVSKSVSQFGDIANLAKINSLVLDKPLKEFVESFYLDFLVKDKLTKDIKTKLRVETAKIKSNLNKKGFKINNLTDFYNIPEDELEKSLENIGLSQKKSEDFSNQILKSANAWKFILYGYKEGEDETKLTGNKK